VVRGAAPKAGTEEVDVAMQPVYNMSRRSVKMNDVQRAVHLMVVRADEGITKARAALEAAEATLKVALAADAVSADPGECPAPHDSKRGYVCGGCGAVAISGYAVNSTRGWREGRYGYHAWHRCAAKLE
jgi:hypothetical protein